MIEFYRSRKYRKDLNEDKDEHRRHNGLARPVLTAVAHSTRTNDRCAKNSFTTNFTNISSDISINYFSICSLKKNIKWFADLLLRALLFHDSQYLDGPNRALIDSAEYTNGLRRIIAGIKEHDSTFKE